MTHVDYGDEFQDAYLYSLGDTAVIIQSGSPDLAEAAAEALLTGPARVTCDTTRRYVCRARRRSRLNSSRSLAVQACLCSDCVRGDWRRESPRLRQANGISPLRWPPMLL